MLYKPSDFNDDLENDMSDMDDGDLDKVLTLEMFADFRHLRLLDITLVDLFRDGQAPTWSVELHPMFAGIYTVHR